MNNKEKIVKILIQNGKKTINQLPSPVDFFRYDKEKIEKMVGKDGVKKANDMFNKFSHAFVLACVMDRQIREKGVRSVFIREVVDDSRQ